jgi:hypothetical protein
MLPPPFHPSPTKDRRERRSVNHSGRNTTPSGPYLDAFPGVVLDDSRPDPSSFPPSRLLRESKRIPVVLSSRAARLLPLNSPTCGQNTESRRCCHLELFWSDEVARRYLARLQCANVSTPSKRCLTVGVAHSSWLGTIVDSLVYQDSFEQTIVFALG